MSYWKYLFNPTKIEISQSFLSHVKINVPRSEMPSTIPAKATNADRAHRQQMAALDHWASSPLGCSIVTCRIAEFPVKAAETSY